VQGLTAPPRDHLTATQVTGLLTGDRLVVSAGLELLDTNNAVVDDISDYFVGGEVERDCYATVHGSCKLGIQLKLKWGKDRVRPYMTLTDGAVTARFNLGVYVLTTPQTKRGETPGTYDVQGYDLLYLLQNGPADTYVVTSGTTYLQAVRDVVTASGVGASVLLDGTGGSTTLPNTMVWSLPENVSYLQIINDLLAAIGYNEVWADWNGNLRSEPFVAVGTRASEWTLDTSNAGTNIVHQERTLIEDVWAAPNWWRFVRRDMGTQPTEGAGIYTVQNVSDGPTSQDSLGRTVRRPVEYLEVADHASLVAQGDRIVAEDRQVSREVQLMIDPLPVMWHRDCFTLKDSAPTEKLVAAGWSLPLDGAPGRLVLGGDRAVQPGVREVQAKATVTTASPLKVTVDGATVESPAKALNGATYALNDRVTVIVRNPQQPMVQGKEA
jgi:hypothetical protein